MQSNCISIKERRALCVVCGIDSWVIWYFCLQTGTLHRLGGAYGIKSMCRQAQGHKLWAMNQSFFERFLIFPYRFVRVCPRSSIHTSLNNTFSCSLFSVCLMPRITMKFPVQSFCYDIGDGESCSTQALSKLADILVLLNTWQILRKLPANRQWLLHQQGFEKKKKRGWGEQ